MSVLPKKYRWESRSNHLAKNGDTTECGVPLNVQNRDARAGAISEAIAFGANASHVRDAATHSDVSQTMDYSRASRENTHTVQRMRMEKSSEKVA